MEATTRRRPVNAIVRAVSGHPKASAGWLAVLFVFGLLARWATQLWGLPDVGDPFDVAAFDAARVPDDRNAFVEYRYAASMLDALLKRKPIKSLDRTDEWSKADRPWRDLVADARPALDTWRIGTECPDALNEYRGPLGYQTTMPVTDWLGMLANLAVLQGSRLEAEGDLAGAWGWHRAALRSSRHSGRHGFGVERRVGTMVHRVAAGALTRWASDPRVDAPLLRRALDEVIAIDAMTVPYSESLKSEYLFFVRTIDDPNLIEDFLVSRNPDDPADWCQELPVSDAAKKPIQATRVILANDKERSLRVVRLAIANWLAQVDKPPARRSKRARIEPPIYEADPDAPPASRALPPEKLSKWLDSSMIASRHLRFVSKYASSIDRERARQARLVVHLASELYRREHGAPPTTPRALVGPYLEALPDGFDAPEVPAKPSR